MRVEIIIKREKVDNFRVVESKFMTMELTKYKHSNRHRKHKD